MVTLRETANFHNALSQIRMMNFALQPWQFFFVVLAGWVNREQQEAIDYLLTENRVLKETHGTKPSS